MTSLVLALVACGATPRPLPHRDRATPAVRSAPPERSLVSEVRRLDRAPLPEDATDIRASPDARHVSYRLQSTDRRDHWVVADGVRQGPWRGPPDPITWSAAGGRLGYYGVRASDSTLVLVVDGRETDPDERLDRARSPRGYSRAGPVAWSPDGRQLAVGISRSDREGFHLDVLVEGERRARFDFRDANLFWSPDGRQLAAFGRRASTAFAWVDGWEKPCKSIDFESVRWVDGALEWSGECDGRRAIFRGRRPPRDVPAALAAPAISHGDRLAYVVLAARQHQLLLDDRIRATHDLISSLSFLPDGSSVVYAAKDGPRQRVVLLDGWQSEPAEEVVAGSVTVRPDGGCVAWAENGYADRAIFTKGVPGHPAACRDRRTGHFGSVSAPLWDDDGGVAFVSSSSGEAVLHTGTSAIALGTVPEPLLRVARTDDGRLAHFAAIGGSLWSVLRAPGDETPVATLVRRSLRTEPDDPRSTVIDVGKLPDDADPIAVGNETQRIAWGSSSEFARVRRLFVDGEDLDLASALVPPTWNDDGHLFWARAVDADEVEVVVDGAGAGHIEAASRILPASRGTGWTAIHWRGVKHQVRRAGGGSFPVGQSPPGFVVPSPDGTRVLASDDSAYPARVLLDGRVVARGNFRGAARWSDDGAHVFFVVGDTEVRAYADTRLVARATTIQPLGFDAAGRPSWVESSATGSRIVLHGHRTEVHGVAGDRTVWDPQGEHAAIVTYEEDGEMTVTKDLVPVATDLRAVRDLAWSADGARLAWVSGTGASTAVGVDGAVVAPSADVVPGTLHFAPDGRLSWVESHREDDGDVSFAVRIGDASHGPFDEVAPSGVVFSPAGLAAWAARRGASWQLFVDGRPVAAFDDQVPGARPTWLADGALGLLAVRARGQGLVRDRFAVRVRWQP